MRGFRFRWSFAARVLAEDVSITKLLVAREKKTSGTQGCLASEMFLEYAGVIF